MVKEIGHFIGGKQVKGKSGRFADVFNPNTGEVAARVALASQAEVRAAVENAKAAQTGLGGEEPAVPRTRDDAASSNSRETHREELATLISMEHGKTIPDALGDLQRGLEVAEFACGIPHLLKGEFTDGAGPGIDMYSMRQPLGVVAGITPFNFPAMIPLWKCAPGHRLRQCLHPEALGARSLLPDAACRTLHRSGPAARHPQCRQWRQGSGRCHPR